MNRRVAPSLLFHSVSGPQPAGYLAVLQTGILTTLLPLLLAGDLASALMRKEEGESIDMERRKTATSLMIDL